MTWGWGVSPEANDPNACAVCIDAIADHLARGMYANVALGAGFLENAGDQTGKPICRGHILPAILAGYGVTR